MKRQNLLLIALMLLMAICLVACGGAAQAHQHTYGDTWAMDETNHWHAATCTDGTDCDTAKGSVTAHADADNNKLCDVCGYDYNHEHTYASEWTQDANTHGYAATCGCTIEAKDAGNHIDAENDGICDTCAYVACKHEFEEVWAMNEEAHWYAATCNHAVKSEEAEHDFNDADICVVCGYHDGAIDVSEAIKIGSFYSNLVNSGLILIEEDTYSLNETLIAYEFGDGLIQIDTNGVYSDTTDYYVLAGDGVYAIRETLYEGAEEPYIEKLTDVASAIIDGYCFNNIFASDSYTLGSYYGVSDLVSGLYDMAKENATLDEYVLSYEDTPVYVFTLLSNVFEYATPYRYEIEVVFTLSEDNFFEDVLIQTERYTVEADEIETAEESEEETTPVTYHNVNLYPTAVVSHTIFQFAGERELTAKYPVSDLATSFDIVDAEGNEIGDTLTVTSGKYIDLYVKPTAPEGVSIALDQITVTSEVNFNITDQTGNIYCWSAPAPGSYSVTVKTLNSEAQTFTLVVEPKPFTSYNSHVIDTDGYDLSTDSHSIVLGGESVSVDFYASANDDLVHAYTASLGEGVTDASISGPDDDGNWTFTATQTGTYVITIVSTENSDISTTLTIEVAPPPSLTSLGLAGNTYKPTSFYGTAPSMTFAFGENNVVITNNAYNAEGTTPAELLASGTYNITVELDGTFVITDSTGATVTFSIIVDNGFITLILGRGYINQYNLERVVEENEGDEFDLANYVDGRLFVSDLLVGIDPAYMLDFSYGEVHDGSGWEAFTYEVSGNTLTINAPNSTLLSTTYTYDDGKLVATIDGVTVTFALSGNN